MHLSRLLGLLVSGFFVLLGGWVSADTVKLPDISTEQPLGIVDLQGEEARPQEGRPRVVGGTGRARQDRFHVVVDPFFHFYPLHYRRRYYRSFGRRIPHGVARRRHYYLYRPRGIYSWRYHPHAYPYSVRYGGYRSYIALGTPTVGGRASRQWGTFVPPGLRRRRERELPATDFRSELSPMLGGPERVDAAFALGEAKLRAGDFRDAVEAFQHSFRADRSDPRVRIALALALVGTGNYEGAVHMLRTGLAGLDEPGDLQLDLDELAAEPDVWRQAVENLKQAAEQEPEERGPRLLLAFVQFGRGRYAASARLLTDLKEEKPSDEIVTGLLFAAESRIGGAPQPDGQRAETPGEPSDAEEPPADAEPEPEAAGDAAS